MKFEVEIPDEVIDEMTGTIGNYGFETVIPSEVLQTIILLWLDEEGLLVRDDWVLYESRIQVTEL